MSRDFAGWAWNLLLGKSDDCTEYAVLEEQNRVTGCHNGAMVSKGGQENLMLGADPNLDNLPEVFDDDVDWQFIGAIGGEFAQRVGMTRKLKTCSKSVVPRNGGLRRMSARRSS